MNFLRLHVTTEGRTEEKFVKQVLSKHLGLFNISADARSVLTGKDRRAYKEYRGGMKAYERAKQDILTWMKEDNHPECRFTTMFDLYALPDDFPGYREAKKAKDPFLRINRLETALAKDINDPRFVPYIQLHEFEALIFTDPQMLAIEYLEHTRPIQNLVKILLKAKDNPELIDDGRNTAPSKRILSQIPEYDKANVGPMIVERIGIEALREKCKHFNGWLTKLENLPQGSANKAKLRK